MKVNVFLLYTIIVVILLLVCVEMSYMGSYSEIQKFKLYKNQELDFNISYPSDWKIVEFSDDITDEGLQIISSFISPLDSSVDPFQEFFTIKTMKLDPKDSFSNNFHQYLERLKQSITNVNISKLDDISNQSKYLKYSFSPQPGLIINKSEYIFLNNDNDVFHIEFTSNNNNKNFELLINKIISSIRIV